jgi:hypothetical protein
MIFMFAPVWTQQIEAGCAARTAGLEIVTNKWPDFDAPL